MTAKSMLTKQQTSYILAGAMGLTIAVALIFFVLAMPADLFEALVSASGVSSVVGAAQPPFGNTARLLSALITGSLFGAVTAGLFLFLDRSAASKKTVPTPIRANKEFGNVPFAEELSFTHAKTEQPVQDRIFFDLAAIRAASHPANDAVMDLGQWPIIDDAVEVQSTETSAAQAVIVEKTAPEEISAVHEDDESIGALMRRLEAGLENRTKWGRAPDEAPVHEAMSPRLRSTLDELRKMASQR